MTLAAPKRDFIRHTVFFSAKDKADIPRIIEGLSKLAEIPGALTFEVVENTRADRFNNDVDVVVYAEFPDAETLQAYKHHQIYQDAITVVKPLRDMRFAADF